jgi:hypothetical protein
MSTDDRRGTNSRPRGTPPRPAPFDSNWDDETVPGLDLDDPLNEFDRVTAVPDVPSEQYVKSVMATAEDSRVPAPGTPPPSPPPPPVPAPIALAPEDYFTLDSEPPPSPRDPDSTARYAVVPHDAPTTRPDALPGNSGGPAPSFSVNGLELTDLAAPQSQRAATRKTLPGERRGPGEPVLESSAHDPASPAAGKGAESGESAIGDMKDRYAMGDFSGALLIAEGILETSPDDLEAPRYAQSCRDVLTQMYSARLGSLDRVVAVAVPSDQIRWLTLDHRAGFLLSLIDGGLTVDQILDISGMPRLDALRIMYQLLDQRVISIGS